MNFLSVKEEKRLLELLTKLKPGYLPREIFFSLARLVTTTTYTIVPLLFDGTIKVHLVKRDKSDLDWIGLVHTPGKIIMPTDKSIKETYSRLRKTEMKNMKIKIGPIFCGYVFDTIPRGKEIALINYILLQSKPNYGKLYNVAKLPKNIIPTEIKRIRMAVRKFKKINQDN